MRAIRVEEDVSITRDVDANDELPWFLAETSKLRRPSEEFLATAVPGPSIDSKPDYESIYGPMGPLADRLFQAVFRAKLAEHAGFDSPLQGYAGIIDIAAKMNRRYSRDQVQQRAQQVLVSMFPRWMPPSYAVLFSGPFPDFSARMNAWATWVAGTWLMGECEVNDVILDDAKNGGSVRIAKSQGLLVKRCRFLEEAGCASVCVNSCKIPTQTFFRDSMGLALTMEPNYDTFECQFSFGKLPTVETEQAAKSTPCLARCPSAGRLRQLHTRPIASSSSVCELMES